MHIGFADKLAKLKGGKVEQKQYTEETAATRKELQRLRSDLESNRNGLVTTENYLEKYLPFRMQNMVSESIHCTFDVPTRRKFVEFEKQKYAKLNDAILKDDGKPNLNKCEHYTPPLEKIEKSLNSDPAADVK